MARRFRSVSPYFTTAIKDGKCAETGQPIRKGDTIAYYPATRQVYANNSKQADELRGQQFSAAYGLADANY